MPCLRIAIVYLFITPAKITLFFETIKHLADYFQKTAKKIPDASRTGGPQPKNKLLILK
jgi:hypothetical protein